MKNKFIVSISPHLHKDESVSKIMWMVVISLIPAGIAGVFIFGLDALWVIILGVVSALVTEGYLTDIHQKKSYCFRRQRLSYRFITCL